MYHKVDHLKITISAQNNVFMCSVWIPEQTAIISLYSIYLLVFKTDTVFTAQ